MPATQIPATLAPVVIYVHICRQRRSYKATFATQAQADAFMDRKGDTCAFFTPEGDEIRDAGTCEHGLSADLCSGPHHYAEPGQPGWN
jgi:hypothetical protein